MAKKKARRGLEWVGGISSMPAYVTGEGEPYRPDGLFWLEPGGPVVGGTVTMPGQTLAEAAASLQQAIDHPLAGRPRTPARVRVATPALADALRRAHPTIEIVCGPTPELDDFVAAMRQKMSEEGKAQQSYLGADVGPAAVGAFFAAAATLFRLRPWAIVPSDQSLLAVTVPELDVRDAVVSVIGQMGESFGLIVFDDRAGFEAYADAGEALERGEDPALPPNLALNFERAADLAPVLHEEIAAHRWELADADAVPWPVALDPDLVARPPTADEVSLLEALALALPVVLAKPAALLVAWAGGAPYTRTVRVHAHAGAFDVAIRVLAHRATPGPRPFGLLAELFELTRAAERGEELDDERRRALEDELVERFLASAEGRTSSDLQAYRLVMDLAAGQWGATIATLGPAELGEVVFELIPRQVSVEPSAARSIIEDTRAFYRFLQREHGLDQAAACLRVLAGDAVRELEVALADQSRYGIAKSLVMAGRAGGFDMDTIEGVEAWMRAVQATGRSPSGPARKAAPRAAAAKGAKPAKATKATKPSRPKAPHAPPPRKR